MLGEVEEVWSGNLDGEREARIESVLRNRRRRASVPPVAMEDQAAILGGHVQQVLGQDQGMNRQFDPAPPTSHVRPGRSKIVEMHQHLR